MTGRPGDCTMEMNGESTASYLSRTLCVPVALHLLIGLEAKGLLDFQGRRGITSVVRWNLRPVIPSSTEPIHAGKNCLGELIWAYITEGAPKKYVWGIHLGRGP